MKVVDPVGHEAHDVTVGSWVGTTIPTDEVPERVEAIVTAAAGAGHTIVPAEPHDDSIPGVVHDPAMLEYMSGAHAAWVEAGYDRDPGQGTVIGYAFPTARFLGDQPLRAPRSRAALAGVFAMDTMTPIGPGTYAGARAAVDSALTAVDLVTAGEDAAYAACRPPGHHAGRDYYGGSCYLNNAACATEALLSAGFARIAIVDIDAHHGNGTQDLFYRRAEVSYGSVHVDPAEGWFPHFMGFADERGAGAGVGANLNSPIAPGETDGVWLDGLTTIVDHAATRDPEALVVSLGVDAATTDPESPLLITRDGYEKAGRLLGTLGVPTVLVQEGGYDLATLGSLVMAVITGFESTRRR